MKDDKNEEVVDEMDTEGSIVVSICGRNRQPEGQEPTKPRLTRLCRRREETDEELRCVTEKIFGRHPVTLIELGLARYT